jgi:hypothetical protein
MTETSPYLFTGGTTRPAGPVPTKPSAWRQIGTTALGTAAVIILATVLMAAAALLGLGALIGFALSEAGSVGSSVSIEGISDTGLSGDDLQ